MVNISERLEAPSRRGQGIGEAEISTRERDAVDALKGIWALSSGPSRLHPTNSMPGLTTHPPFPEDVPTCPLLIVDYQLVRARDKEETDKLWKAATELGFW